MGEGKVLCGSNSYTEKFYFNDEFRSVPDPVKKELQIMCVAFTEQVGGTLMVSFTEDGELRLELGKDDGDYLYDDIEAELSVRQLQKEKAELFGQMEEFYRQFVIRMHRAEAAARELEDFLAQEAAEEEEREAMMEEEEGGPRDDEEDELEEGEIDPIEYGEELYEDEMAAKLAEDFRDPDNPEGEISLEDYIEELLNDE